MNPTTATFELTLFNDEPTRGKLHMLNTLEAMFDDARNVLPEEYFYFSDKLPLGSRVRVTFELIE